jgi:hypothetical protein
MSDNVKIVRKEGYLNLTISGAFSLEAAKQSVDILAAACDKENCYTVLFDCRPMTGEMPIFDRYQIGRYGTEVLPHTIKFAMLGREDQVSPDAFFENVAVNRGMILKVFSDEKKAIEWLKK